MTNELLAKAIESISSLSREARVELIRTSPYGEELFMGYYFSEYIKYPFAPFHFEMFQDWRDLQSGKIRELAWIMFRESAKTSIAKVLMTKAICFKERQYVNIDSFDKDNSETFLFDVAQNLLTNRRLMQDFGYLYEKKRSSEEMTLTRIGKFLTKNNIITEAHSVAESVRGRIYGAQRPDFVCHKKGTDIFTDGKWMKVENYPSALPRRKEIGKDVRLYSLPYAETVTNEHRYWARHIPLVAVKRTTLRKQNIVSEGWEKAKNLTSHHYIGHKIDTAIGNFQKIDKYSPTISSRDEKGRIVEHQAGTRKYAPKEFEDKEWWWFFGLWWGDGHLSGKKSKYRAIGLTIANDDTETQVRVFSLLKKYNIGYAISPRKGCFSLTFGNAAIGRWLRTWRVGNSMKQPPLWVERLPLEYQKELILGYIAADGYCDYKHNEVRITSVYLNGLYSARRILARLGVASSIREGIEGSENYEICGVKCKTQKKFDLRFREGAKNIGLPIENQTRYSFPETFIDGGFLWSKVKSINESKQEIFCPITTENHTYSTHFGLSHNCLDDFETNKTKDSEAYTAVTKSHIEEFSTGLDSKAGILYLGNYITKTGIVQWIMDRAVKDDKIRVRMVPIEDNGQPTWPEKYCLTDEAAEKTGKISLESKKKQFDFVLYQTEMMNNPITSEQQIFKKEMFKYISYDEVMKLSCRVFMTIDTAISQKNSADYTGICINFIDREGFWNLMTFKRRMTPKQLLDFIFEYWEKYKIEEIGIEKTTFQMALKEFFEEEMRKRQKFPRMVDLLHKQQKKEERIRGALLGRYESGSIRHITNYTEGLEEEALAFPGAINDDVLDATGYQDQIAKSPFAEVKMKVKTFVPQNCS